MNIKLKKKFRKEKSSPGQLGAGLVQQLGPGVVRGVRDLTGGLWCSLVNTNIEQGSYYCDERK